jgi:hypothetical protein
MHDGRWPSSSSQRCRKYSTAKESTVVMLHYCCDGQVSLAIAIRLSVFIEHLKKNPSAIAPRYVLQQTDWDRSLS